MRRLTSILAVAVLFAGACAQAATIRVPADEPTIQDGVDTSVHGDTVLVASGIYFESVSLLGKRIALLSEEGSMSTVIRGVDHEHAILCPGGEDADTRIEGFTLRDASVAGIECATGTSPVLRDLVLAGNLGNGASCIHASPTFRRCQIYGNAAPGIYCNAASVKIDSCAFTAPSQAGLRAYNGSDVHISNSVFIGSDRSSGEVFRDSGALIRRSSLTMVASTFEGFAGFSALNLEETGDVAIESSVFRGNSAELGAALFAEGDSQTDTPISLSGCVFEGNTSTENGGACVLRWCRSASFEDCVFAGNETEGLGGAVSSHDVSVMTYAGCEFIDNRAGDDGGGIRAYGPSACLLTVSGCLFDGNAASGAGSAIRISDCGGTIENCTVFDCSAGGSAGALHFGGSPTPDVTACIVSDCTGTGLSTSTDAVVPFVSYCDVYGCSQGSYGGLFADLTGYFWNISEDPQFCDVSGRDFELHESSPCAGSGPGGSDMGAFGVGCGIVAVEEMSWGAIKARFR